jgi:hypothetical protein
LNGRRGGSFAPGSTQAASRGVPEDPDFLDQAGGRRRSVCAPSAPRIAFKGRSKKGTIAMKTRPPAGTTSREGLDTARRELARRRPEALLLVQLMIEDDGFDGVGRMQRLAGQLRLCADIPELAEGLGCPADAVDPGLMRAAAALLADAARTAWI